MGRMFVADACNFVKCSSCLGQFVCVGHVACHLVVMVCVLVYDGLHFGVVFMVGNALCV